MQNQNQKDNLEELTRIQWALEVESAEAGAAAVRASFQAAKERGNVANSPAMKGLVSAAVERLHGVLLEALEEANSGRAGRKNRNLVMMEELGDLWAVSFHTVAQAMTGIGDKRMMANIAYNIGAAIQDALIIKRFKKAAPGLFRTIVDRKRSEGSSESNIIYNIKRQYTQTSEEGLWTVRETVSLGEALLNLLLESSDVFEQHVMADGDKRSKTVLTVSDKYMEHVERSVDRIAANTVHQMPMVIPPVDWTNPIQGGYLTKHREVFVRRHGVTPEARNAYMASLSEDPDMEQVYAAVNAIQRTPWQVNRDVLKVVSLLWQVGGGLADLPTRDFEAQPEKPSWYYTEGADTLDGTAFSAMLKAHPEKADDWRDWRHAMHGWYVTELACRSKRISTLQTISLAERFAEYDRFYFPHSLDFRGRIYPIPARLSPQGNDLNKGLLRFANGKPLGKSGVKWLEIHLANTYGVDKVSFDERRAWVGQNASNILASARNPMENLSFWTQADSPLCFLAACFEYLGFTEQGEGFVSHLPIALDGTCNGLQNFSAMLRDPVGGAATNLTPSGKPQDIYGEVARACEDLLQESEDPLAAVLRGRITRNIVKPNVMTVPYGVTKRGMIDQLIETLTKYGVVAHLEQKEVREVATFLAEISYMAIGRVVVAAQQAMDWLKDVAKLVSKADCPIVWKTPMGFTVRQDYRKQKDITIDTNLGKFRIRRRAVEPTDVLDKAKQALGISPNFVHSMDACHLMATVCRSKEAGVTDFAFIHDSYGTHACDTDTLSEQLREAFIWLYSGHLLQDFSEQLASQVPEEVAAEFPPLPPMGHLDLGLVRQSQYFFA